MISEQRDKYNNQEMIDNQLKMDKSIKSQYSDPINSNLPSSKIFPNFDNNKILNIEDDEQMKNSKQNINSNVPIV